MTGRATGSKLQLVALPLLIITTIIGNDDVDGDDYGGYLTVNTVCCYSGNGAFVSVGDDVNSGDYSDNIGLAGAQAFMNKIFECPSLSPFGLAVTMTWVLQRYWVAWVAWVVAVAEVVVVVVVVVVMADEASRDRRD